MKLQGEHLFDGPRERVWEILRDPNALAQALPGTQSLEKVSENEYQGQMHVRIGPVAGLFAGRVVISNEEPPESCTLSVDGKGSAGFANGTGDVHLTDRGDGTTLLQYQGEFQVGGKLAAVGQRLVDTVSKSIIRQGLESLNAALQVGEPSQAETAPAAAAVEAMPSPAPAAPARGPAAAAPPYRPPSEAQFAAGVVKDLAAEYLTPEDRSILLTGVVAVLAVLVGFWLGSRRRADSRLDPR